MDTTLITSTAAVLALGGYVWEHVRASWWKDAAKDYRRWLKEADEELAAVHKQRCDAASIAGQRSAERARIRKEARQAKTTAALTTDGWRERSAVIADTAAQKRRHG